MPCGSAKDSSHTDKNGENGHCAFQDLDHSILQHSLTLGVNNVKQIMMSIQKGTKEVKDILFNECNIIYECKVCANLFRSLANFLYHKRCYCKKHLCEDMLLFDNFEEDAPTVVIQPEPPEENQMPRMVECTVDLVKTDVAKEKSLLAANSSNVETLPEASSTPKEKTGRNKGGRGKEQPEEDGKKTAKSRSESPMISRRTREKNKRVVKTPLPNEPPNKKTAKSAKVADNVKSLPDTSSKLVKEHVTEPIIESKEKTPPAVTPPPVSDAQDHKQVIKDSKEVIKDSNEIRDSKEAVKDSKEMIKDSEELIKDSKEVIKDSKEMIKDPKDVIKERENKKTANKTPEPLIKKACVPSSKEMFIKPLKKIIIAKPKSVDLKNGSVFDNIQKNMKANKIGFTKITNAAGKSLQCFPKIIFKTIDGNPHAVFQTTDNSKSESISLKSKAEGSVVQTQSDNEKLIIVLKKDSVPPQATPLTETKPVAPPPSEKVSKMAKTQTEFHMTRRKRLLARTD